MQINQRAGLTFAAALRSILRSDPDVVMVGEIRDGETAKISIEAALTGHLVLSTLHTNDAPSALTRLNEMGVEPFLTGAAVSAVLAQRLARKLCTHCCEMYAPSVDEMIAARDRARRRGRERRHGVLPEDRLPALQPDRLQGPDRHLPAARDDRGVCASLAAKHASRDEIERAALESDMKTLWDDGLAKVARASRASKSSPASPSSAFLLLLLLLAPLVQRLRLRRRLRRRGGGCLSFSASHCAAASSGSRPV